MIELEAARDSKVRRHRFTVQDFIKMDAEGFFNEAQRVELIDGELIEMTPIGSQHGGHVDRISRLLAQRLNLDDVIVRTQNSILLSPHSQPQPDISVARFRSDFYTVRHPSPDEILLLIEVADSSLEYDRRIKTLVYARAEIPELWIVNLRDRIVEVFREPTDSGYGTSVGMQPDDVLSPLLLPFLQVRPNEMLIAPPPDVASASSQAS